MPVGFGCVSIRPGQRRRDRLGGRRGRCGGSGRHGRPDRGRGGRRLWRALIGPGRMLHLPPGGGSAYGDAVLSRVVVVGASLAGLRAAETLRNEGFDGRLTLIGAETHLPYDRPPLSKKLLAGRAGTPSGCTCAARPSTATSTSTCASARRATGLDLRRPVGGPGRRRPACPTTAWSSPPARRPGGCPASRTLDGVHVLRTLDDCLALRAAFDGRAAAGRRGRRRVHRRRGGGHGAAAWAARSPWSRRCRCRSRAPSGRRWAAVFAELHGDHGVDVRLGVGVAAIEGDGPGRAGPAHRRLRGRRRRRGRRHRGRAGHRLAGRQRPRAARRRRVRRRPSPPGRPACSPPATSCAGPTRCSARRCASSTGPTPPSRAPPRPATCSPRRPAARPRRTQPVPFFWSDQYDARIQFLGRADPDDEVRRRPRLAGGAARSSPSTAAPVASGACSASTCRSWSCPTEAPRHRSVSWDDALAHAAVAPSAARPECRHDSRSGCNLQVASYPAVMSRYRPPPSARPSAVVPLPDGVRLPGHRRHPRPRQRRRPAPPSPPPAPATAGSSSCPGVDGRMRPRRCHRPGRATSASCRPAAVAAILRGLQRPASVRASVTRAVGPLGPGRAGARRPAHAARRGPGPRAARRARGDRRAAPLPAPARDPAHRSASPARWPTPSPRGPRPRPTTGSTVLEATEVGARVELVLAWAKDHLAELKVNEQHPPRRHRGHGEAAARVPAAPAAGRDPQGAGRGRRRRRRRLPHPAGDACRCPRRCATAVDKEIDRLERTEPADPRAGLDPHLAGPRARPAVGHAPPTTTSTCAPPARCSTPTTTASTT